LIAASGLLGGVENRRSPREIGSTKGGDVRQLSSQQEKPWGQTIDRLDRVSRAMNPLLLFIAVSLVVLNLACVVNLINWSDQPPATPAAASSATTGPATPASAAHATTPSR
jgi:hypothetical protein